MNGKYAIVLKSPMGPKKGFIYLKELNNCIEGKLDCLGKKHLFTGTISDSGKISLEGILRSPLGEEPFLIQGTIQENVLTASFKRRNESYEILGLQVDDNKESKIEI
ncbi:hypothetical protein [Aminipila terrae]|uniref:Uncharacterized protein n=1 Tax=Aminipila terrae TaxID=2697030 RepID=A0A6P1MK02_9FIRM|nr:hypothetical protein [Aminipila terrae]QHI72368.1 hypothetical protein Ami3637_08095 [Aminipila terrae]